MDETERKFVHHRIQKRKLDVKESILYADGIEVPAKRVKKETSRHVRPMISASAKDYVSGSINSIPYYITRHLALTTLKFRAQKLRKGFPFAHRRQRILQLCLSISGIFLICSSWTLQLKVTPKTFGLIILGVNNREVSINHGLDGNKQFPWSLQQSFSSINSTAIGYSFLTPAGERQLITSNSALVMRWHLPELPSAATEPGIIDSIPSIYSNMRASFIESYQGEPITGPEVLLQTTNRQPLLQFIKFSVYLASNNMLSNSHIGELLQWVINDKQESMLTSFLSVKLPTTEAFARQIFENSLRFQHMNVARILLEAGADPNLRTRHGDLPLVLAAGGTLAEPDSDLWCSSGINTSGPDNNAGEAFRTAAANGSIELVQLLLDAGADIDATDTWCSTALLAAAKHDNIDVLQLLLDVGAEIEATDCWANTALLAAAKYDNRVAIQILLDAGADIDAKDDFSRSLLQIVSKHGNSETVELLLDTGADIDATDICGVTALHAVTEEGNIELVRLLLNNGAATVIPYTYEHDRTEAERAMAEGDMELVRELLDSDTDGDIVSGDRFSRGAPTVSAAAAGNMELVQILLAVEADIDAQCCNDPNYVGTALHVAARNGDTELVRILLDADADINTPAPYRLGRTALQAATESDNIQLVRILLDECADVNAPPADRNGLSALQAAAVNNNPELVQILLNAGADINTFAATGYGRTAL